MDTAPRYEPSSKAERETSSQQRMVQNMLDIQKQSRWLTVEQAASYLGCSRNFLDKDRCSRLHGIAYSRLGRHVRYFTGDLDDFLVRNRVQPGEAV